MDQKFVRQPSSVVIQMNDERLAGQRTSCSLWDANLQVRISVQRNPMFYRVVFPAMMASYFSLAGVLHHPFLAPAPFFARGEDGDLFSGDIDRESAHALGARLQAASRSTA